MYLPYLYVISLHLPYLFLICLHQTDLQLLSKFAIQFRQLISTNNIVHIKRTNTCSNVHIRTYKYMQQCAYPRMHVAMYISSSGTSIIWLKWSIRNGPKSFVVAGPWRRRLRCCWCGRRRWWWCCCKVVVDQFRGGDRPWTTNAWNFRKN